MSRRRRGYQWADTIPIRSARELARAINNRRTAFATPQSRLSESTGVDLATLRRVEQGDHEVPFGVVVRLVDALELDLELRPRGSDFAPRPPTKVSELGLSPRTMSALKRVRIENLDQLGSATAMLELPELGGGTELHEIVCALSRHGLSLRQGNVPGDRDREIFRLRVVEGLTLDELGKEFDLRRERIRQILNLFFGLTGTPPAATNRRRGKPTLASPP